MKSSDIAQQHEANPVTSLILRVMRTRLQRDEQLCYIAEPRLLDVTTMGDLCTCPMPLIVKAMGDSPLVAHGMYYYAMGIVQNELQDSLVLASVLPQLGGDLGPANEGLRSLLAENYVRVAEDAGKLLVLVNGQPTLVPYKQFGVVLPAVYYDKHTKAPSWLTLNPAGLAIANAVESVCSAVYGVHSHIGWWKSLATNEPLELDYTRNMLKGAMDYLDGYGSKKIADTISLIHSEVSEAYEGHRTRSFDDKLVGFPGFAAELTDALIRIADASGGYNLNIGLCTALKLAVNLLRADHKPENRAATGGKRT